jgi:hypothetical protein
MILLISYGGQRLAVTVQPPRQSAGQAASAPTGEPPDEMSVLLFSHSLSKALSQMFGAQA